MQDVTGVWRFVLQLFWSLSVFCSWAAMSRVRLTPDPIVSVSDLTKAFAMRACGT